MRSLRVDRPTLSWSLWLIGTRTPGRPLAATPAADDGAPTKTYLGNCPTRRSTTAAAGPRTRESIVLFALRSPPRSGRFASNAARSKALPMSSSLLPAGSVQPEATFRFTFYYWIKGIWMNEWGCIFVYVLRTTIIFPSFLKSNAFFLGYPPNPFAPRHSLKNYAY